MRSCLSPRTRIVSFSHVSNALGTITPAREMVAMAHRHGALVLVDGAQAVSHMRTDVQALDCDFYVFSGHKVFASYRNRRGLRKARCARQYAALAGRRQYDRGRDVREDYCIRRRLRAFEAGTGNIADAVGLGAALDYVEEVRIREHCRPRTRTSELCDRRTAQRART
jgi:cysteine desulfurase/selenocysteine lyase